MQVCELLIHKVLIRKLYLFLKKLIEIPVSFLIYGGVYRYLYTFYIFVVLCHTLISGGAGITCEGHFSQQVLDLWCNAQFVQVQAEIKSEG